MSLIKKALDKAQKNKTGSSSDKTEEDKVSNEVLENPEENRTDVTLSQLLVWSLSLFLITFLIGLELVYLLKSYSLMDYIL